ncbi:MAG: sugar ABC transporter substrate-binding protein, partial [Spirochaetales bacterium]|nr:sugar ABC transporter substrate-binding protein [Spirochaetales bacterium]
TANEWKNTNLSKVTTYIREQIVEVLLGNITAEQAVANVDSRGATYFK